VSSHEVRGDEIIDIYRSKRWIAAVAYDYQGLICGFIAVSETGHTIMDTVSAEVLAKMASTRKTPLAKQAQKRTVPGAGL
jgi:hypothetical protein